MNRENENKNVYVIDSLPKLARYLGAVALEVPGALVKILTEAPLRKK